MAISCVLSLSRGQTTICHHAGVSLWLRWRKGVRAEVQWLQKDVTVRTAKDVPFLVCCRPPPKALGIARKLFCNVGQTFARHFKIIVWRVKLGMWWAGLAMPYHEIYHSFECEADLVMNYKVIFSATQQVCAEGVGFVGVVDKVNPVQNRIWQLQAGLVHRWGNSHGRLGYFPGCFGDFWRHSAGLDRFFMSSECDSICLLWIVWLPSCSTLMFSADLEAGWKCRSRAWTSL